MSFRETAPPKGLCLPLRVSVGPALYTQQHPLAFHHYVHLLATNLLLKPLLLLSLSSDTVTPFSQKEH